MRYSENRISGWGKQWIQAISRLYKPKQLQRGLRAATTGQVLSLNLEGGFAAAQVQGTPTRPHKVEIGLPMFTQKQWTRVTDGLLKKAFYAAKILAGEMPVELGKIFDEAGASLTPISDADISSDCSCYDAEDPCKHVIATYYLLAQEIDRDPFILMEMRGLSRAKLLTEIQARRDKKPLPIAIAERPSQTHLSHRVNDFYRMPPGSSASGPMTSNALQALLAPGSRIHEMGSPPFWQSDNHFEDVLVRIYQAVRKRALG